MNGPSTDADIAAKGRNARDAGFDPRFLAAHRDARRRLWILGWLSLFALLLSLTRSPAHARDAAVLLNNYAANCPIIDGDHLAFGDDFGVQLLGGPVGGALRPILIAVTGASLIKLKEPGFFDAGIGIIPDFPDDQTQADFFIQVWKGAPTYDAAGIKVSATWTQSIGEYPLSSNSIPPAALRIPEPVLWLEHDAFNLLTTVLTAVRGEGQIEMYPPSPYSQDLPPNLRPWPPAGPVSLHGVPDPGYRFVNWIGFRPDPQSGSSLTIEETNAWLNFDLESGTAIVVATFEPGPWLQINAAYGGSVTNWPTGTNFTPGTVVSLTAIPSPNFALASWSGDVLGTNSTITLNMATNTTVTANFVPLYTPYLVVRPGEYGDGFSTNRFAFTLLGESGQRYQIERSPDLVQWTVFAQITAAANITQVSDTTITNRHYQYYRARKIQ